MDKVHHHRSSRLSGTRTVRRVRRAKKSEPDYHADPEGFAKRTDGISRVRGGHRAWGSRKGTSTYRQVVASGAPSVKPRKGNRGHRIRMGYQDRTEELQPLYDEEAVELVPVRPDDE